jgi:hypothetical protein
VVEVTSYGGRGLKVKGRLFACQAVHKSAEPNSLMVRVGLKRRASLMTGNPNAYYLTDHYAKHPAMLVRLSHMDRSSLRELLTESWEHVIGGVK